LATNICAKVQLSSFLQHSPASFGSCYQQRASQQQNLDRIHALLMFQVNGTEIAGTFAGGRRRKARRLTTGRLD
jgi:hypothetical protein